MLAAKIWPNGEFWVGGIAARPQGLVVPVKNHKAPKGAKGMTSAARRTVRQGTHLLEETYGYENLTLFTGTLPGDTDESCSKALAHWSEICRRFIQEVRRLLLRCDFPPWFVGATEIQPKRFEATGQPWPHLHLVLPTRQAGRWVISGQELKDIWSSIAARRLGVAIESFTVSGRVDRFKSAGSVGRYLSKYLAKGQTQEVLAVLDDEHYPRVRNWHHCSHELTNAIAACTSKLTNSVSRMLYAIAAQRSEGCIVWAEIADPYASYDLETKPLGFVGSLEKELMYWLLQKDEDEQKWLNLA
jgi:hypothetical protein